MKDSSNYTEKRVKERSELLKLSQVNSEIGYILSSNDPLENMLQRCLKTLVTQLGATVGAFWLFNREKDILQLQASIGLTDQMEKSYSLIKPGLNLIGCIAQTEQPYATNSLSTDSLLQYPEWVIDQSLRGFVGIPLILSHRLLAVCALFSTNAFSEYLTDDLQPIFQLIALGLERKQLAEQLDYYNASLNSINDVFIIVDLEDQILFWNNAAEKLYGWSATEALDKNIFELLYKGKEYIFQHVKAKTSTMREGQWLGEMTQTLRDGKEIVTKNHWRLVCNALGQPKSINIVINDISEKKQLVAQLMQAQRVELFGTLAGGIAHDFNNIFSPILISSQILKMRTKDEKSLEILKTVESTTQRGVEMIKQMITFIRGLEGKPALIQLRHLINDITKILKESFPKSIELSTHTPADTFKVVAEFTQIYQTILNICVNARNAMPSGGTLTITLENIFINENEAAQYNSAHAKTGYYVAITVSDTGIGIPNEVLDKIFDPFFTTKESDNGTGLGLSIVKNVVSNHNGFLTIKSEINKGTAIKIYLPASASPEEIALTEGQPPMVGKGELVLIVDDELAIRDITAKTLEAFNYRTITAADGIEALTLYLNHKDEVKLIITDIMMPLMNGVQLIKALQKIGAEVKVIVTSGAAIAEVNRELEKLTFEKFLPKPYTAEVLLSTIATALTIVKD